MRWTREKNGNVLVLRKAFALLQVRPSTEARINSTSQNDRPRRPLLIHSRRAAEQLPDRQLLAPVAVLRRHGVHLGPQPREERLGDGIARRRPVQL